MTISTTILCLLNARGLRHVFLAAYLAGGCATSMAGEEPVAASRGPKPTPFDVAVERGMARALVRQLAGEPDACLGVDLWIYVDCQLVKEGARRSENETVCIGFTGDRVTMLKLVPLTVIRELVLARRVTVKSARMRTLLGESERARASASQ